MGYVHLVSLKIIKLCSIQDLLDGVILLVKVAGVEFEEVREFAITACKSIMAAEEMDGDVICEPVIDNYGLHVRIPNTLSLI